MPRRDPSRLTSSSAPFDLLVIGAGIIGSAIAWDATLRGLSVALIDRSDFGSATSAGNFKIIHGGLRYLQHLDFSRLFQSVREQKILRKIAPHLIHPFPFLIPCYSRGSRSPEFLRAGLTLYDLLTVTRNAGLPCSHHLPHHRVLSRDECLEIAPGINRDGLRGGVIYFDCQMTNSDRMTLSFVLSAAERGAIVCNYVQATSFEITKSASMREVTSVHARDVLLGTELQIRARAVVIAAGPWTKTLEGMLTGTPAPKFAYSKGLQLVLPKIIDRYAVAVQSPYQDNDAKVSRGGRSYFLLPWQSRTLVGTADILHQESPDSWSLGDEEVRRFIDEVREVYRSDILRYESIQGVFGGLRPVEPSVVERIRAGQMPGYGSIEAAHRDRITDLRTNGIRNVCTIEGIKYTTARSVAECVVGIVFSQRGSGTPDCTTGNVPLIGGDIPDFENFCAEQRRLMRGRLLESDVDRLVKEYGALLPGILRTTDDGALDPIAPNVPQIEAEILNAVRNEMAVRLDDVVFRRTSLGTCGHPGTAALLKAAEVSARELAWSRERMSEEIDAAQAKFWSSSKEN